MTRRLDFLLPVYDRPAYLHRVLSTGLALDIPGAHFVVIDDASSGKVEQVPGLGDATVESVCRAFRDSRVIYSRNPENLGMANTLVRYYRELCDAEYTSLINPKDEFIDGAPIREALARHDADPALSLVVYPIRQGDPENSDRLLSFHYERMTGKEFIARHIADANLQHCSGYAVMRVQKAREAGIPRNLNLRALGIDDAPGIDHDMLFSVAAIGDVDFVSDPPVRRWIGDGYTQRFPLTFAYTQYQYARRLVLELGARGLMSRQSQLQYLSFRLMLILWGAMAVRCRYTGVVEDDFSRPGKHLKIPLWVYAPLECLGFRMWPTRRMVSLYAMAFMPWLPQRIKAFLES